MAKDVGNAKAKAQGPATTYLVQSVALCLLFHADTYTHLARVLNHAVCVPQPDAFHAHMSEGLRAHFPDYPCTETPDRPPSGDPTRNQLLYLLSRSYAAHAAYLKPPILSLPEAWCFCSVVLTWLYTAVLLLPPLRRRLSARMQLIWLLAATMNDMFGPLVSWGLLRSAPPSFVRHYPPVMCESLGYTALLGLPEWMVYVISVFVTGSLSVVSLLLRKHGLAREVPYSLPHLWVRHLVTLVAVVAFTCLRSRIWAGLLRRITPAALCPRPPPLPVTGPEVAGPEVTRGPSAVSTLARRLPRGKPSPGRALEPGAPMTAMSGGGDALQQQQQQQQSPAVERSFGVAVGDATAKGTAAVAAWLSEDAVGGAADGGDPWVGVVGPAPPWPTRIADEVARRCLSNGDGARHAQCIGREAGTAAAAAPPLRAAVAGRDAAMRSGAIAKGTLLGRSGSGTRPWAVTSPNESDGTGAGELANAGQGMLRQRRRMPLPPPLQQQQGMEPEPPQRSGMWGLCELLRPLWQQRRSAAAAAVMAARCLSREGQVVDCGTGGVQLGSGSDGGGGAYPGAAETYSVRHHVGSNEGGGGDSGGLSCRLAADNGKGGRGRLLPLLQEPQPPLINAPPSSYSPPPPQRAAREAALGGSRDERPQVWTQPPQPPQLCHLGAAAAAAAAATTIEEGYDNDSCGDSDLPSADSRTMAAAGTTAPGAFSPPPPPSVLPAAHHAPPLPVPPEQHPAPHPSLESVAAAAAGAAATAKLAPALTMEGLRAMVAAARAAPYCSDPTLQLTRVHVRLPGVAVSELPSEWRQAVLARMNKALPPNVAVIGLTAFDGEH